MQCPKCKNETLSQSTHLELVPIACFGDPFPPAELLVQVQIKFSCFSCGTTITTTETLGYRLNERKETDTKQIVAIKEEAKGRDTGEGWGPTGNIPRH